MEEQSRSIVIACKARAALQSTSNTLRRAAFIITRKDVLKEVEIKRQEQRRTTDQDESLVTGQDDHADVDGDNHDHHNSRQQY